MIKRFFLLGILIFFYRTSAISILDESINGKSVDSCKENQFLCGSGECIPLKWKCDFNPDCADGSDELYSCGVSTCKHSQFQCSLSKRCIPRAWICDGELDCGSVSLNSTSDQDMSDEDPLQCKKPGSCPPNMARCGNSTQCEYIEVFCDNTTHCENSTDEGNFCDNMVPCHGLNCTHGCKPTGKGPACFCPEGMQPHQNECIDMDECDILDYTCDQICKNKKGSFSCSCVPGYVQINSICKAINVPENEPASIIVSTSKEIKRVYLNGTSYPGSRCDVQALSLTFDHRNRTICFIHRYNKIDGAKLSCAKIDDLSIFWDLPPPTFYPLLATTHVALDWVSGNWYYVDDDRDMIYMCTSIMKYCTILIDANLNKPRSIALDPTKGYMFFTKWGIYASMVERAQLNGLDRKPLVDHKIVYPYGLAVDIPSEHVYWVDTYLDFVERINYDGSNRRTIQKGFPVINLYDISVFENYMYVTSWRLQSVIKLSKFNSTSHKFLMENLNGSRPFTIHVYHRQVQPEIKHPCMINNGGCDHICVTAFTNKEPTAQCLCQPGYKLTSGKCTSSKLSAFLIFGKSIPPMIKGIPMNPKKNKEQIILPLSDGRIPTSIDYDVKTQSIYYSGGKKNAIERIRLNGTKKELVKVLPEMNCEGLAIDWTGRNLFWTDEGLGTINVFKLDDPVKQKVLITNKIYHPRSIVLDPKNGFMYWGNWPRGSQHSVLPVTTTSGSIERAWMDGNNQTNLVNADVQWPISLTLDFFTRRLYWSDVFFDKIECIDLDGKNRQVIKQSTLYPYGIAIYNDLLFWTETDANTSVLVKSYNLVNKSTEILGIENPPLFTLKVYNSEAQVKVSPYWCEKIDLCPGLCVSTPNGPVCMCNDGYKLKTTDAKKKECVKASNYYVQIDCNSQDHFQCIKNKECLDKKLVCDGDNDCGDGSDEDKSINGPCYNHTCPQENFSCDGNKCISKFWVCDGENDCNDKSDEKPNLCDSCLASQFLCTFTKRCIPHSWVCDGTFDCGDGDTSDEHQYCSTHSCQESEFTCINGHCIPFEYYCNAEDNCGDGSDEEACSSCSGEFLCTKSNTCIPLIKKCDGVIDCAGATDEFNCTNLLKKTNYLCSNNEFLCSNYTDLCIDKHYLCDGLPDCPDGSDEDNCTSIKNCTLENCHVQPMDNTSLKICPYPNKSCDNNTMCVSVEMLCNDKNDCLDGSDEGGQCVENLCETTSDCSHTCINSPNGFICLCPDNMTLQLDGVTCLIVNPCNIWGHCSQKCIEISQQRHKCTCNEGYFLTSDHFTCKSTDATVPQIIFSNKHELRGIDLVTRDVKSFISSLKNTVTLDFYHAIDGTDTLYWTDVVDDKIFKGTIIDGSLIEVEVVVQTGLTTAEGLAVDWVAGNIYWVESNFDQIEVAKLNGSFRKSLITGDMESPRAIALDPRFGYLFWTDWDSAAPRIERCSMSGEFRKIIVLVSMFFDGEWPNGLTLDYELNRIYWIDAKSDSIHTVNYDGDDHHLVLMGHDLLSHSFAITIFENDVYWTDWRSNSVNKANKWTGSNVTVVQHTATQPFDVKILHPSRQPKVEFNPCGINNGNCSHLCLLNINSTYKCDCPHLMQLSLDNHACIVNEVVLLFAQMNEIRGVNLDQPYYNTIPTLLSFESQPLLHVQIDYLATDKNIYWSDYSSNEIKRSSLSGGNIEVILDTGIHQPHGFAIDWMSKNIFVSSDQNSLVEETFTPKTIIACNLDGEYFTTIYSSDWTDEENNKTVQIGSLATFPQQGKLFWAQTMASGHHNIIMSNMDGSSYSIIFTEKIIPFIPGFTSLTVDQEMQTLYWVNFDKHSIHSYSIQDSKINPPLNLPEESSPSSIALYKNNIYYVDNKLRNIQIANKITGNENSIFRNITADVYALSLYDPSLQTGINGCSKNKGLCSHICLPISNGWDDWVCRCADGYTIDPENKKECIGASEFLLYTVESEIKGISLIKNDSNKVLSPLSKTSMAFSIDFYEDYIYWSDDEQGTIMRIKRDGTDRQIILNREQPGETSAGTWVSGIAIDWIARHIYWANPLLNIIQVAYLNGSNAYVVLDGGDTMEKPNSLAVDPVAGFLFWSIRRYHGVSRSSLDGMNRKSILLNKDQPFVEDITLDYTNRKLYFCQQSLIGRCNYDGTEYEVLYKEKNSNPVSIVVHDGYIYWLGVMQVQGLSSLMVSPINNISASEELIREFGEHPKDVQIFSKSRHQGINICAKHNGGCQELCLFNGTHGVCTCAHGIVGADGKSCKDYTTFLMYSRMDKIDSITLTENPNFNTPFNVIQSKQFMQNVIALSYDYTRSLLFYSDNHRGSIDAIYFNNTGHRVIVEYQGSVEGIDYEMKENRLYWTNSNASISQINLNNPNATPEIILQLGPSDRPRGIAVEICDGRMYWTNWNDLKPSIQRAFLSGFKVESIITTEIQIPNALTLDHMTQKMYWGDAKLDKIERCEYDGTNRVVLAEMYPQHPFDIAVFGDYFFWTDWMLHAVLRADKYTGANVAWLRKDVYRPMGIVAVADNINDCFKNPCMALNGGCEDKCRLDIKGVVECSCSHNRILLSDKKRCIESSTLQKNCSSNEFVCSSNDCVPYENTCDGIPHCQDESDEAINFCATRSCPEGFFSCQDNSGIILNRCLPMNRKCDGHFDCFGGFDEVDCSCPNSTYFRCKSGDCIAPNLRCDHDPDCTDASDEMGCVFTSCEDLVNDATLINCNTTTACIHPSWICDGQNDCWDNSDEQNCSTIKDSVSLKNNCLSSDFKCLNGKCIAKSWRCDGDDDCGDSLNTFSPSSDELNCPVKCKSSEFQCKTKFETFQCLPASWQCDKNPDCLDGSDEPKNCLNRKCSISDFKCNTTGRCIPSTWVCDKEDDCGDGSDENIEKCKMFNYTTCPLNKFECVNKKCIFEEYYCDGNDDCGDNSDEPDNCKIVCDSSREFTCGNGVCVLQSDKCNGKNDCGDNSDENVHECNLEYNKDDYCSWPDYFLCHNKICINANLTCNGINDCGDFSDERQCNSNECSLGNVHPCEHICIDHPVGYECKCHPGYKSVGSSCHDINECNSTDIIKPCNQICYNTIGSFKCECTAGYTLLPDGSSCKASTIEKPMLVFANKHYIKQIDLRGMETEILINNLTNVVAVDYDYSDSCFYWSDIALGSTIKRKCKDKSAERLHGPLVVNSPDGIAVDWVAKNLYWCDKGKDTIEVSKLNGQFRKVLITKNLQEPRAISLDPIRGYMYWTDWGEMPHIGKAGMDGSEPRTILNESLGWPNALAISLATEELFWADAKEDYIAYSDLNGNNRRVIMSRIMNPSVNIHHVFAITLFENFVYWSDWETKSIHRCHKYSGKNFQNVTSLAYRPMDIKIKHPLLQPSRPYNPCEKNNGGCKALCLLSPNLGRICACPQNFILAPDNMNCIANCSSMHFVCANTFKCIPFWWHCDKHDDCGDGSDEPANCTDFYCTPGQFQCTNNQCIHPSQICNGISDCKDSSDEENCENYTCLETDFKCQRGSLLSKLPKPTCISNQLKCNGIKDCLDGEDEADCKSKACGMEEFKCEITGKCIPKVFVCDEEHDCGFGDSSDEPTNCTSRTCAPDEMRCNNGRCIHLSWQCDGEKDCPEMEDEPPSCFNTTCDPTYFKCANGKCIPGRWRCDNEYDCGDESDETGCSPKNCSDYEFRCSDGRCIPASQKCDGRTNCGDNSDEAECDSHVLCGNDDFHCNGSYHCISPKWRCDGDLDCPDGSDEWNCTDKIGKGCSISRNGQFVCNNGDCISLGNRCDGEEDCADSSDENRTMCALVACPPGKYRCDNNNCVFNTNVCDNVDHCGDGSDETITACASASQICDSSKFRCANGQCINRRLRCNGHFDCSDNSDELLCTNAIKTSCQFGTCSQICLPNKNTTHSCHCVRGYSVTLPNKSCRANGAPALLVVASHEGDIFFVDPYKSHENLFKYSAVTLPTHKIHSIDILWTINSTYLLWSDHNSKALYSTVIYNPVKVSNQTTRDVNTVKQIVQTEDTPESIAIDWVTKNVYWIENCMHAKVIKVSTVEGKNIKTLIKFEIDRKPQNIVLDPQSGSMYWSDLGHKPHIETCSMDGSNRRIFISDSVRSPAGLTIDYAARRLYWSDIKPYTIETVSLDGKGRRVIYKFPRGKHPTNIELFEDSIYVALLTTIVRIDKFGNKNMTVLSKNIFRATDLVILQENKHPTDLNNYCAINPCHSTALCVPTVLGINPNNRTCLCADNQIEVPMLTDIKCVAKQSPPTVCEPPCSMGVCVSNGTSTLGLCKCDPFFTGDTCDVYSCHTFCHNNGICMIEPGPTSENDTIVKCKCTPKWTGDRCDISVPSRGCPGGCLNDGNCIDNICDCLPGITGKNCEKCVNVDCKNGGICMMSDSGIGECQCAAGFKGPSCTELDCDHYCSKQGTCFLDANGPLCKCHEGYTGVHCELNSCTDQICLNGGTCYINDQNITTCLCPPQFKDPNCGINICNCSCLKNDHMCHMYCPPNQNHPICDKLNETMNLCHPELCKNGGTCIIVNGQPTCRCVGLWGSSDCSNIIVDSGSCLGYCYNNGTCYFESNSGVDEPNCKCSSGWTGQRCTDRFTCVNYCLNGGTCIEPEEPTGSLSCHCHNHYDGDQCQTQLIVEYTSSEHTHKNGINALWVILFIIILLIVITATTYYFTKLRRRGRSFLHVRMQENIEVNNPMYIQDDIDDEDIHLDRAFPLQEKPSGNFGNPVYDSVYSAGSSTSATGSEESKGLLQSTNLTNQILSPENSHDEA